MVAAKRKQKKTSEESEMKGKKSIYFLSSEVFKQTRESKLMKWRFDV